MKNPSSGSRVVPCERTDVTQIRVAFRKFDKALEKGKTKGKGAGWNVNNTEGTKERKHPCLSSDAMRNAINLT
jgi:hypothetical protein